MNIDTHMNMKCFTGWEYLAIDCANNNPFNGDKATFEARLSWFDSNINDLEAIADENEWKEKPLFLKAIQTVRLAQEGKATGHLVGMDAICSGMQIMSVLTGCYQGALATGLVDPDVRSDAYKECSVLMESILGTSTGTDQARVKQATMTTLYGSKKEPVKEFGADTDELEAFYKALFQLAPGACTLLQELVNSWQPFAKAHQWILPDGYCALVRTTVKKTCKVEVDELQHSTFNYVYYPNEGEKKAVKNAANIIHSIDAYILRSLVRRCSYDLELVAALAENIQIERFERVMGTVQDAHVRMTAPAEVAKYIAHYERSTVVDMTIVPYLDAPALRELCDEHLAKLQQIISSMLEHNPFEVITIHDDFKAHPNNINNLRYHYREILAELADSDLMADILSQIHGDKGTLTKLSSDLSTHIRKSSYSLS